MAIITKADIESGKRHIQEFEFEKLGGSLKLRPLTGEEFNRINSSMKNAGVDKLKTKIIPGMKKKNREIAKEAFEVAIDPVESERVKFDADIKAIFFSLQHEEDTEGWTEEDIKRFPVGAVEEIVLKVYEISGVEDPNSTRNQIDEFRE